MDRLPESCEHAELDEPIHHSSHIGGTRMRASDGRAGSRSRDEGPSRPPLAPLRNDEEEIREPDELDLRSRLAEDQRRCNVVG